MTDRFVVDASPLILLGRVQRLDLLPLLADEILVPNAVLEELQLGANRDAVATTVASATWVKVVGDEQVLRSIASWDLGAGETQVLAFAATHQPCKAIVDDGAARRCATTIGVTTIGTVGLVLRAKNRGVIPLARPLVEALRGAGLYLTEASATRALAMVGE